MPEIKRKNEITPQEFDHLVQLAALQLDEEQSHYLRHELNKQLNAIQELESIPIPEDLTITTHGVLYGKESKAELREDASDPFPNPNDIITQAPQTEGGYLSVPDIPHTTLE